MQSTRLPARWRKLLLTVHIATTVSVLGTDLVLLALGIASMNGSDQQTIYPAAHLVGAWLVAPLAVLSLGTGVLLAVLTGWGLLRYWWVTIKLTLTTVLTGVVLFVLVPRLDTASDSVNGPSPDFLTSSERLPLVAAPAIASTLLLFMITLAIFKPGWRLRSRTSSEVAPAASGGLEQRP